MQRTETGVPIRESWDPLSPEYLADPYAISRQLREETPIFYAPKLDYYVITRMKDILEVFTDDKSYASVLVQDPVFPLSKDARNTLGRGFNPLPVMSNRPEPDHGRIRVYTRQGFSNRRLKLLDPYIRKRCNELVDAMLEKGDSCEFVKALAFPLPGETVFRLLGFPEGDDEMLKGWCGDRKAFSWGRPSSGEQVEIAKNMLAYWEYCRDFTAKKRTDRGDDFTSELLAAHDADETELSYHEVESIVYGLSFAGHEAVTNLICNCLLCLLPRRGQWDEVVAQRGQVKNAVEEVLRFESSQISWRRITTQPTALSGMAFPKDAKIFLNFAAANRDPAVFEDPDRFDIHRKNANKHVSFGKGIHFCLGSHLARLEATIVVDVLAERLPSVRIAPAQEITFHPNVTFRGPEKLELQWSV